MSHLELFSPRCRKPLRRRACGSSHVRLQQRQLRNGGNDGGAAIPARGRLLQSPPALITKIAAGELLADPGDPLQQALLLQAGSPVCDVVIHRIQYTSVGGAGKLVERRYVPSGTATKCVGTRPVVLYARGTRAEKDADLTNLESSADNPEGVFLAAYFAAQG